MQPDGQIVNSRLIFWQVRHPCRREFAVQRGDSDLSHAVCSFISPSHLLLLRHAVAHNQIHSRLGDAAADWQTLSVSGAVIHERAGVVFDIEVEAAVS